MSYSVGQIVYVVLRKETTVCAMQITEEIVKKTLEGEVTTYTVRAGPATEKPIPLDMIDGEIFESPDDVKKALVERVSSMIEKRIADAVAKAKEWYPAGHEVSTSIPQSLIKKDSTTPPTPVKKAPRRVSAEVAELANELQAETTMMELPNGVQAKVRSIKLPESMQS